MQRTKNYKLRLIEMSDTFSTEPLNQNMTDLDDALAAADSAANALAQRVTALEVHRLSAGTYTGSTSGVTVNVGFKPKAVIIGGSASNMIVDKIPAADGATGGYLTSTGFTIPGTSNPFCYSGRSYNYLALA
jgi:hypothetical protein